VEVSEELHHSHLNSPQYPQDGRLVGNQNYTGGCAGEENLLLMETISYIFRDTTQVQSY
jgi:hypothetical protein